MPARARSINGRTWGGGQPSCTSQFVSTNDVFRGLVGTSLYDYVLRERLAQALNAVVDGDEDITGIALNAGFASHSHFTARFRRFFGCPPVALRRTAHAARIDDFRKIVTARVAGRA